MPITIKMPLKTKDYSRLLKALELPDPSKRRQASELLSGGDERALYPLIKALRDPNHGVQDAAMRSLISVGGEVTAYMVIPLLREEAYLRNTAMIILKEIGSRAVPFFNLLLVDKDDDIRKFAIDLICEIGVCEYPEAIARLLIEDPNPNVRASAAKAIGVLNYRTGLPQLIAALKDEEWVCFSALESLAVFRDDASISAIETLISSTSDALRFAAIEALGTIKSEHSGKALLNHLQRSDGFEKTAVVKSLVQTGVTPSMPGVSEALMEMFKKGDWNDKTIALKGLVALGETKAVFDIADSAGSLDTSAPDTEDKLYMIKDALMNLAHSDSIIDALNNDSLKFRGRIILIEVLGDMQCREAVPHLLKFLGENIRDVRRASVRALAGMSNADARLTLIEGIEDYDGHIRRMSAEAIGKIGEKTAFEPMMQHLPNERYDDVKEEMVKALMLINESEFLSHINEFDPVVKSVIGRNAGDIYILLFLSEDGDSSVRASAISGLGRSGQPHDERIFARLKKSVCDRVPDVRKAAVAAMGELRCCREGVESALKDEDTWVRINAIQALARFSDGDAISHFLHMINDKETPVVLTAIEAIASIGGREAFEALRPLHGHSNVEVSETVNRILESL